jgi:hypothetical protein
MEFDDDTTSTVVAVALLGLWALVGAATWAAARWWGDGPHYHPAYVLYGLTALVWIVLPSVLAFLTARDAPYSTLARSVANLDAWLGSRGGTMRGLLMALLFGYLISMAAYVLLHVILAPG